MIVLGIDPGTRVTGYGIVRKEGSLFQPLDFGCICPPPTLDLHERYCILFDAITSLIETFDPKALSIETQYIDKNVQSAIKLGMARGVALVAAAKKGLSVHEYAPTKAKRAVVGTGRASKEQVQGMIATLLHLQECPPKDAADALALALCHLNTLR